MRITIVSLIFTALVSTSCHIKEETKSATENIVAQAEEVKTGFVHAVYFWLKKDNPTLLNEFTEIGLPQLAKVPSIRQVYWGPPAGTPRDVVDNSYDLAWVVTFDNAQKQDEYQVDPLHLEFVEKYKSLFEKVKVYDNVVTHSR